MNKLLEVSHLTKKFGDFFAVDSVSFEAEAHEIFGLLGPNGAGKTTTIRVIATVLQATGGTAIVDGHDIVKEPQVVRSTLGLLTSDIGLYDRFTARENLRYFGRLYGLHENELECRIDELVELLDMKGFADRKAGKFSTGMKQKVAIARSVIHNPNVIIFDEPTSGLDVLAAQTVIRFMKRMKDAGKLVILSTHDMAHAKELCDRVAIIHRSKLIANDSVEHILASTKTTTLEHAFIEIVGKDESRALQSADELKHLTKSPARITNSVTMRSWITAHALQLRIASIVLVFAGVGISYVDWFGEFRQTVGYIVIGIAVVVGVVARFLGKKKI